ADPQFARQADRPIARRQPGLHEGQLEPARSAAMSLRTLYTHWLSPQRWLDRAGVGTATRIAIGLVLLMTCVLLFASALRLFPGPQEAELRRRTTIAEMAAIQIAVNAANNDQALL